jgi:RNA polymerase primary sigma factor
MRKLVFKDKPTNRETASVDRYLKEIAKYKLLSPDEETKYAKLAKTGDQSARDMLINCNLRFVVSVAKQYENLGLSLLELINEGNIGLVKAVSKFDETRGFKLITYAVWWIRREILLAINQQSEYKYFSLDKELHEGELTLLDSLMSKDYYNLQND